MRGSTVRTSERRKRHTLQTHLDVLRGRTGRVAARPDVLQRVQPRHRLPEDQGEQGQKRDQWVAGRDQGARLGMVGIL